VISLGLRLTISGGREAIIRLVILAVAVGLGVGLLLTAVAATNAVSSWNSRHAWFSTGSAWVPPGPVGHVAPLWWHPSAAAQHPGGPARQPLPRPSGRHDRRRRAAVAGLAGHHRRA